MALIWLLLFIYTPPVIFSLIALVVLINYLRRLDNV
jgi:hypothetical protein